jgi:hypothetical protein
LTSALRASFSARYAAVAVVVVLRIASIFDGVFMCVFQW